jgi:phytoene dehydrogenase-like protein
MEEVMNGERKRVVIIGAGHNGLVAACYLAKAGLAPLVLERRDVAGGVAVTEELHPGFLCPAILHSTGPLLPKIAVELELPRYGLSMIPSDVRVLALDPNGRSLRIYEDSARTAMDLSRISAHDGKSYTAFRSSFAALGRALGPVLSMTPPDVDDPGAADFLNLGRLGLNFRSLDRKDAYRLLRWGPMPVADLVAEWFETDLLRATFAAQGIFGAFAGPWSAGTSVGLLLQAAMDGHATGPGSVPRGGIGSITDALVKAASAAGATLRTSTPVAGIRVKDRRATGVLLANGDEITASAVISGADPKHTFLKLVDPAEMDPDFLMRIRNYRCAGSVAKVNLAVSALPRFPETAGRIHIGPDIDYLERAFDAAKYGEFSTAPYMDVAIPSLADPSLAPKGAHVLSVHVQYAPYQLTNGNWKSRREEFGDAVIRALSTYAPDLGDLILHRQVITPLDLEQTYGLTGGHIFHGEHALDQLFMFRPLIGWSQYRTPIKGLYLCGAGTHPGGGLTGAPGANASREVLKDLR